MAYHRNWFDGSATRHPRVRFGNPVHVYNNLYVGNEYGVASTMDAGVLVEGNYFEDVEEPTLVGYADPGRPRRLGPRRPGPAQQHVRALGSAAGRGHRGPAALQVRSRSHGGRAGAGQGRRRGGTHHALTSVRQALVLPASARAAASAAWTT